MHVVIYLLLKGYVEQLEPLLACQTTPRTVDPRRVTLPLVIVDHVSPVDIYTTCDA